MTDPLEDFNNFQEDLKGTEKFMQEAIYQFLTSNSQDLAKAESWGGYLLAQRSQDRESPENEVPPNDELVLMELNKLQWIAYQILNELRYSNNKRETN